MNYTYIADSGVRFVRDHLKDFPRPDRAACEAIRNWASERGQTLDPDRTDVVVLHHQWRNGVGDVGVVVEKMTLTQAVLANWQGSSANDLLGAVLGLPWAGTFPNSQHITLVDHLDPPPPLQNTTGYLVYNGLFRQSDPAEYSARTHVQLPAEAFQQFIWNLDLHNVYTRMLDSYWHTREASHRLAAKLAFITACNRQVADGSLGDDHRRLAWRAAGLESAPHPLHVRFLNIYGYVASDLLQISDSHSGLTLLYIPGNSAPLHSFADQASLQDWIAAQCRIPEARAALKQHFALADLPDGLDFSGLGTALDGLGVYPAANRLSSERPGFTTEGVWHPRTIVNYKPDQYSPLIDGDLFQALTLQQRARSYADAEFDITSDSEVTKARWRGYLNKAVNLLAPLAIVVPELAPIFAVGGIAQFGLGLDQAINGHDQQAQADGVGMATFGLLNALPLVGAGLKPAGALFRVKNDGFLMPSEVNGQLGYPMSPVTPPRLPIEDVEPYFHIPDTVPALPGADDATFQAVARMSRYNGKRDLLTASIGGYNCEVVYDLEKDSFIIDGDENMIDPPHYCPVDGSGNLRRVDVSQRSVSDSMRTASLRAMGIDLPLPVQIPSLPLAGARALPKHFTCLWVGDKVIDEPLLANLGINAQRLHDSQYSLRLCLSTADTSAYAENLRLLAIQAPGVEILPLEEQSWYTAFRDGPYHAQYQAAIEGRNFSSASDVLRYPMLHSDGGIYMDIDDTLLAVGEYPYTRDGQTFGAPGEALDSLNLSTTNDGLVLYPPMSNQKLGMNCQFNSSLIGSHAGNPTLLAISEEMRTRYLAEPDFYASRPNIEEDPDGFYRYAAALSRITGPAMLSDMVARHVPYLHVLRQIVNLFQLPHVNAWPYIDLPAYTEASRALLPLSRCIRVGSFHSWAKP